MQRKITTGIALLLLSVAAIAQQAALNYTIDLNDRTDDTFKVTLTLEGLTEANAVYQFASTAPGTYQTMNIGRFVKDFQAFDKKGREISTKKISENQWQIEKPSVVRKITYKVAETWDTPVKEYNIYKMCGTSLEDDHALINPHCVFGFPQGMQDDPLTITLNYPKEWLIGTALNKNENGAYYASDYDLAVDSPILLGRLTRASTDLRGAEVEIYTYSKTDKVKSEQLMSYMTDMLESAGDFVVDLPVDRYTFLFHFEDESWGAWEHSYSSEYVFEEMEVTEGYAGQITDIAAHEFFHIITPLNIHSEIIEQFNFETPTPSEHLWLYEGTTEWAAHIMQLRSGLKSLDEYLMVIADKYRIDEQYDPNYSLSELALKSYSKEGQQQYGNIYMRGALVAGLLDIRLLELSGGTRGYREVILELSKKFGKDRAFPEKDFFKVFAEMTYPEIADFFDRYVKESEPLPTAEYFAKIGIVYQEKGGKKNKEKSLGAQLGVPDGKIRFVKLEEAAELGLEVNDELYTINGTEVTLQNANQVFSDLMSQDVGTTYSMKVKRGEEIIEVQPMIYEREVEQRHNFRVMDAPSPKQLKLREAWIKNL